MKLIPKARPVRIRISSGGVEHSTLDSLKRHFDVSAIIPMINDGRLLRWLRQRGESAIAEMIESADEIKDTEISFSEVPMFNTDISPEEAMSFWDKQFESVPDISMKDILNRSEDEFSFDYDLSNMKELMDKFDNSKWADLSEDERMDLVEQAVSKIADILGLNEIPEVMYFEDDPSNCGYYYSGLNILGINVCELSDPKELINTVAHELRHAYQEQRAMDPETEMDYKYLTNLSNYISPLFTENGDCILFTDYQDQLAEAEARAFANLFSGEEMVA